MKDNSNKPLNFQQNYPHPHEKENSKKVTNISYYEKQFNIHKVWCVYF